LISTIVRTLGFAAAFITAVATPAAAYVTDSGTHAPPTTGAYAYYSTFGTFGPDRAGFPGVGQTFVDPVFGSPVRRLTNGLGRRSESDIYGKNGYWNSDGTLMFHNAATSKTIINTTTGALVRANVPGNYDGSFAPDDPDTWYYFEGASLRKYSVATGTTSVVKTFSATLGALGGSVDWIDQSGRYMVLNIGGSARVWDKQSDVLYAGTVPGDVGSGWAGISPDGTYLVTATDLKRSYAINHATHTVNTTGVMFWSLCGGHGDLLSATDGKTYFVTFECYEDPGVWAVDVSLPQTVANRQKQRDDNRRLFATEWVDDGHMAAAARGMFQDWAFISVESNDDPFTGGVSGWRPYKQEIVMANVLTGEIRRLAHHRSRGIGGSYYYQPRVSVSWDGTRVAWASNFGYNGPDYGDIYSILLGAGSPPPPPPPPVSGTPVVTFTNPAAGATLQGTATVTLNATGGSGTGYTYKLAVDGANVYTGTNNSMGWNTTNVSNAAHTLTATVTDSAGKSGTASRSVTVSNVAGTPSPTVSFTAPAAGATVSGTATVTLAATGGSGTGYAYKLAVDGITVYTGTNKTIAWNTTTATNAAHTLVATVTDSKGKSDTASRSVTVSNSAATLVATLTNPKPLETVSGSVTVGMKVVGSTASTRTFTLLQDGVKMWTKSTTATSASWAWKTDWWAEDGWHTLKLRVTDSAGKTVTTTAKVRVIN
jgi:Big-like domain-containing protein